MSKFLEFGERLIQKIDIDRATVYNAGNKKKPEWMVRVFYYDSVPPSGHTWFDVAAKSESEAMDKLRALHNDLEKS